jgi:hypothetical protein
MHSPPAFLDFFPLRVKYSLQHLFLKHPQSVFLLCYLWCQICSKSSMIVCFLICLVPLFPPLALTRVYIRCFIVPCLDIVQHSDPCSNVGTILKEFLFMPPHSLILPT